MESRPEKVDDLVEIRNGIAPAVDDKQPGCGVFAALTEGSFHGLDPVADAIINLTT